jgi:1-acyl-sn-glycerol-3-phosphate acyltransferase
MKKNGNESMKQQKQQSITEKQDKEIKGSAFYGGMHRLLARFFLWLFRVRVHYVDREPEGENYLLCSNHLSAVDPILLAAALHKQQPHFMAKKELFKIPLLSSVIRAFGAYPVDRAGDVGAIKTSIALLESGKCVGMFPQGTRCRGRAPRETMETVKNGAGLLIDKTHVTVLPVCMKTKKNKLSLFCGVDIIFGEPIPYETLASAEPLTDATHHVRQAEYSRMSHEVFERICTLYEETDQ